ncbi:MAG: RHS repeat-associated core domain-containing protein [Chloroflexota bacterium]|nr:RHS repeat-associated core domain-containing protein [Chloroflexota bacterium]MDQ5866131.1 RHS repeat-associated core domain-containing protein [Chloroflexota bacterium]
MTTSSAGEVQGRQEFDPWGKVRTGGITQTKLNFTGQKLDSTGLLYYHARYYDPSLARFASPDTIVPGLAMSPGGAFGALSMAQNSSLTVDFHESGLVSSSNRDNAAILGEGFPFQRGTTGDAGGPQNPQALNRYSYTLNNPVRFTDPTGHAIFIPLLIAIGAGVVTSVATDVAIDAAVACFTDDCSNFDAGSSAGRALKDPWTYTGPIGKIGKIIGTAGKAGKVIGFINKSGKAVKTNISDKALDHSFKRHGEQWFGTSIEHLKGREYLSRWKQLIETATEKGRAFESSVKEIPTTAFLYREGDRYFVAHYHRDTGEFITAFVPDPDQLHGYRRTISGK